MTHPRPRTVLITGASVGLGLAIARELLANTQFHLILTARAQSMARFAEQGLVEGPRVWLRALEVTSAQEREAVIAEIEQRFGALDVLINNAGIAYRCVVEHVDSDERQAQMDVNFLAPMELIRRVLPAMRAQRSGRILSISSVGGMMAMPTMAVYSASKFALEGSCEALWYEVRPWSIHVTLVQPGFIHSDGFTKVRMTRESQFSAQHEEDPYHEHYASMEPFIGRVMQHTPATPESVARTVRRTICRRRPPLRVTATWDALFFSLLRRFMPRTLYHRFLYWKLPNVKKWGWPPGGSPG
ncbi:MAG: SDR family NAD(P)-dependent oxidoreductase [Planctomycetes bacterium]|nr:SDR family NAD(P)-dependent oxidoreductase [Planctomycetota bacterium]MCB9910850.1 SDR family NAD(P)-dependent oxidoreductase [Planctomycetota bacterium]MCB9912218.1 SDR family NAD(P)-dependent oxidoreductase [Planctomycetota bacterium]HPF13252.1 SDR family NAD(P)-dependent oxidoreductase [Planctomycetota bacterium]